MNYAFDGLKEYIAVHKIIQAASILIPAACIAIIKRGGILFLILTKIIIFYSFISLFNINFYVFNYIR